ncbi:MAG: DNA repair exonuclease [Myxococcales bacterium]|nr:DNA repair exonuclease [Myxococcales bacterium]MCB9708963.1 DNA repair exonuclease [Myxococcales bacterium]
MTTLRFIHSSDWQLGMPFRWLQGDGGAKLRELRMLAIDQLAAMSKKRGASFVLVAGDLFDDNTVSKSIILEANECIGRIGCPVYVIPGNHDYGGPASIYSQSLFLESKPANLIVLGERKATRTVDDAAWLLPAPLLHRHEAADPTAHITESFGGHDAPRIGIAHGTIRRFDKSGEGTVPNLIDPRRAELGKLDYLALGDWHGLVQVNPNTWYSGTPEATSFKDNQPGHVLLVTMDGRGTVPHVEPLKVGQARWIKKSFDIYQDEDINALYQWLDALEQPRLTLASVTIKGSLSMSGLSKVRAFTEAAPSRLLHYQDDSEHLLSRASASDLDSIASDGYLRAAIERLIHREKSGDQTAAYALQILYQLHHTSC